MMGRESEREAEEPVEMVQVKTYMQVDERGKQSTKKEEERSQKYVEVDERRK